MHPSQSEYQVSVWGVLARIWLKYLAQHLHRKDLFAPLPLFSNQQRGEYSHHVRKL